jgi:hypothetical protein
MIFPIHWRRTCMADPNRSRSWWGHKFNHPPTATLRCETPQPPTLAKKRNLCMHRLVCITVVQTLKAVRGYCFCLTGQVQAHPPSQAVHISYPRSVLSLTHIGAYRWMPKRGDTNFQFDEDPMVDQEFPCMKRHHVAAQIPLKIAPRNAMQHLHILSPLSPSQPIIRYCQAVSTAPE